jgi:6-phosphogluconolactonase (cycloisomerase 2 family)
MNRRARRQHDLMWGLCLAVIALFLLVPAAALATSPAFTPAPGSPLSPSTGEGSSLAYSPSGGFLASGTSIFSVATSGALTPVGGTAPDPYAGSVAFSPSGAFLAVADKSGPTPAGGHTVSMFSVGSSGELTPVSGSPFTVGSQPTSITFSPDGSLLAVTAGPTGTPGPDGPNTLYVFSVSSSGALTPVAGSPYSSSASQVLFSPAGGLLAAVDVNTGVTMYSVNGSGALTKVTGSPFKAFGEAPSGAAFGPTGSFLAVSNFSGGVTMYSVAPSGTLTPVGSGPFDPTFQTNSVAFSTDGSTVAATENDWQGVSAFSVAPSGALTILPGSPFETSAPATSVAFSPSGLLSTTNLGSELTTLVPSSASSSTNWDGAFGKDGYDLAAWDGQSDVSNMPGVSVSLLQGSRFLWAANTSDPRALPSPDGLKRTASTYFNTNQIQVRLTFHAAYTGNLRLYAVDWDHRGRQESINVSGQSAIFSNKWGAFSQGQWAVFPINVAAGGTVTITVTREAGVNAVLSGIFLGDSGAPPAMPVSSSPQGTWTGTFGSSGYDLAAWEGSSDLTNLPHASLTVVHSSRFVWSSSTSDVRALQSPDGLTRRAATYFDANQVSLSLRFNSAYTGNVNLYAVDWDHRGRRELVSVGGQTAALSSDFSGGAWLSFPVSVSAGQTVPIVVDQTAGVNAVLSGIFLG